MEIFLLFVSKWLLPPATDMPFLVLAVAQDQLSNRTIPTWTL